ncbi:unnamed protein product [Lupinus luteus]|uniref:Uncharacterized protein n=1 Tax=Lupinus luteus TaxID=3873 RepID=A0AAV1Y377_LUPLU
MKTSFIKPVTSAATTSFSFSSTVKFLQPQQPERRASLIKLLQLLVAHHTSRRRRKGCDELLVSFDDFYPTDIWFNNEKEADKGSEKMELKENENNRKEERGDRR